MEWTLRVQDLLDRAWLLHTLDTGGEVDVQLELSTIFDFATSITDVHEPLLTQMLAFQYPTLAPPILTVQYAAY